MHFKTPPRMIKLFVFFYSFSVIQLMMIITGLQVDFGPNSPLPTILGKVLIILMVLLDFPVVWAVFGK